MIARRPQVLEVDTIYTYTHPPQAVRLDFLMEQATRWCQQTNPDLLGWVTKDRCAELMHAVDGAIGGLHGGEDWSAQYQFLDSDVGREYMRKLTDSVNTHVAELQRA